MASIKNSHVIMKQITSRVCGPPRCILSRRGGSWGYKDGKVYMSDLGANKKWGPYGYL